MTLAERIAQANARIAELEADLAAAHTRNSVMGSAASRQIDEATARAETAERDALMRAADEIEAIAKEGGYNWPIVCRARILALEGK